MRSDARRTAILLILALAVSACTLLGSDTTTTVTVGTTTTPGTSTSTVAPTTTVGQVDLLLAEVLALAGYTEELRELRFLVEPTITILTREELADRVRTDIEEELDPLELARDQEALRILGVLPAGMDLGAFYTDLLAEQVAGFYDSETKEMVVQASEEGLSEYDKMVIVHELTHALSDQHFDFGQLIDDLLDAEEYDQEAALSALIEGEATLVETAYLQALERAALLEIIAAFDEVESPVFDSAPYFIQESLLAPYIEGLDFAERQFSNGGWAAIDAAYRFPPRTTEELLHQDAYATGVAPIEVALPGDIPAGYEVGEESTWGESGLKALLGAAILPGQLTEAAVGWGGDRYRVLWDGERAIFQMHYIGDTPEDTTEVQTAFIDYLTAVAPEGVGWWVLNDGEHVAIVVASDPTAGSALVGSLAAVGYE